MDILTCKIRPAGRHILTIGGDLIQNEAAAIAELVKNSYDADATFVGITFVKSESGCLQIIIEDDGHGMSLDTILTKWLVPSTTDKVHRQKSPKGRVMQGKKGIGRYAAAVLGEDLLLETIKDNQQTTIYIVWDDFEKAEFLNDVDIAVETKAVDENSKTRMTINVASQNIDQWDKWNDKLLRKLRFELRKLQSPVYKKNDINDNFRITICCKGNVSEEKQEDIVPLEIFDFFDYQIKGTVDEQGRGDLWYLNNKNNTSEAISKDFTIKEGKCGKVDFDFRVYDREAENISRLAEHLSDLRELEIGKNEVRSLLNTVNGIGVYRAGFRIRPLGDPDFDWLELNKKRVQNPSMSIGSNQIIGFVTIESEEDSNLKEKSARDGLVENQAYTTLQEISCEVLRVLEAKRFEYRRSLQSKTFKYTEDTIEIVDTLMDMNPLKTQLNDMLESEGVSDEVREKANQIIGKEESTNQHKLKRVNKIIAMYQGQATLGSIINVVLHESRQPLNFLLNALDNLKYDIKRLHNSPEITMFDRCLNKANECQEQVKQLNNFLKKLDPLSSRKRGRPKKMDLLQTIKKSVSIFEEQFKQHKICFNIEAIDEKTIKYIKAWEQDISTIFTNLVDNSIYWLIKNDIKDKRIIINIVFNHEGLERIDYKDNGLGISSEISDVNVIFRPGFTKKIDGMGLGLAISGEAAKRSYLNLVILESDKGVHFRITPLKGKD